MNCKQGDLAIVLGSRFNDGKIVRCIEFLGVLAYAEGDFQTWIVDPPLPRTDEVAEKWCLCPDSMLRPIRDPGEDATDETLIYAGLPQSTKVGEAA